jgi:hypothetical protein
LKNTKIRVSKRVYSSGDDDVFTKLKHLM